MTDPFHGPWWIDPRDPEAAFPDVESALREPDGLLAVGGDLSEKRLLQAYRVGIFPWYSDGQPVLWWSPDPRSVLFPEEVRISRSLRKSIRKGAYTIQLDTAFSDVVRECAKPRKDDSGTWITREMLGAYVNLHRSGMAHSVEVRADGELIGGLYGIAIGRIFFGESMFSRKPDASKIALAYLARFLQANGFPLIDCQIHNDHLETMGARQIQRRQFSRYLQEYCAKDGITGTWNIDPLTADRIRESGAQPLPHRHHVPERDF